MITQFTTKLNVEVMVLLNQEFGLQIINYTSVVSFLLISLYRGIGQLADKAVFVSIKRITSMFIILLLSPPIILPSHFSFVLPKFLSLSVLLTANLFVSP
jgi:hypothetical protein